MPQPALILPDGYEAPPAPLPECRNCACKDLRPVRLDQNHQGTRYQRLQCRACGEMTIVKR